MKQYNPDTPMMRQFLSIKEKYPNEILFFRMGDFYEMFLDDAVYASRVLDIALTKRGDDVPMCGIPHHSWQNYVLKILQSGKNIAICEQVEDPKKVQNRIVRREVVRILTPGTIFEEELINKSHTLLASVFPYDEESMSLVLCDLSTRELWLDFTKNEELGGHLTSRFVTEVLITKDVKSIFQNYDLNYTKGFQLQMRDYHYTEVDVEKHLKNAFNFINSAISLASLELSIAEITNLYRIFSYIEETAPCLNIKWQYPKKLYTQKNMQLDDTALLTLEILKDQEGNETASLFSILNKTQTSGGKRMLREMLLTPSLNKQEIEERYSLVDFFISQNALRQNIIRYLREIKDSMRILNYLAHTPKVYHLGSLLQTLQALQKIKNLFEQNNATDQVLHPILKKEWLNNKGEFPHEEFPHEVLKRLETTLFTQDLPPLLDERRFVKEGFSEELDQLFHLAGSAHKVMSDFEKKEQAKWGISTLKIRYSRMIGYYIEISKGLASKAPEHYKRRQTLTNAERFTLDDLIELESKILNAKEKVIVKQKEIFDELITYILSQTDIIIKWAYKVYFLDVIISLTEVAIKNKYVRPTIREDGELILKNSRHPVVESLFKEEIFVSNDAHLNQTKRHLAILTGPNMSGKSTYIRQIGLIQIMAQIGSFVPASQAELSLVDRIFTRIGAYDRLFRGESTFFVEMLECAKIFRNYTKDSLILLDEVGRGTSTFDGVSIARSMLEYLNHSFSNQDKESRAKTLFATHFTELADLINQEKGIIGLTVGVVEENNQITFLRKIKEGVASKSYGIYVANLAGVPVEIIARAQQVLEGLEKKDIWESSQPTSVSPQLKHPEQDSPVLKPPPPNIKNTKYRKIEQQIQEELFAN